MQVTNFNVHNYARTMGRTDREHNNWKSFIASTMRSTLHSLTVQTLDMYNMDGTKQVHNAGTPDRRLVIFGNMAHRNAEGGGFAVEPTPINGIENDVVTLLPYRAASDQIVHIGVEGKVLAEYDRQYNELLILFDLFGTYNDSRKALFTFIMQEFERLIWLPKTLENSWVHSQSKEQLAHRLIEQMKQQHGRRLQQDKDQVEQWNHSLTDLRQRMKNTMDNIARVSRSIVVEEEAVNAVGPKVLAELDLIVSHDKVKDVHVKDGIFIVFTKPLHVFTEKGERFYLGNMRIELDPEHTDVRFYGDNGRRGYWTAHDPHPHVDGGTGHACLGNASAVIAELSHQMQLYPLALTAIDFLESANIHDPAGRKVYNWDMCDENGNITRRADGTTPDDEDDDEDDEYEYSCDHCEEGFNDNGHTVYRNLNDEGEVCDERWVCQNCFDNHYHWSERHDEYIHNDYREDN